MVICTCNTLSGYFKTKNLKQQFSWHLCAEALNLSTKNKPSSQSPKGIVNHENFLEDISYKQQATSIKRQAASGKRPTLLLQGGGWAHKRQAFGSRTLDKVLWLVERGS